MFERFTRAARQAVIAAHEEGLRLEHDWIGTEHLVLGLLRGTDDIAVTVLGEFGVDHEGYRARLASAVPATGLGELDAEALRSLGIDLDTVREKVEETFGSGALDSAPAPRRGRNRRLPLFGHVPFTPRGKKVLNLALREAINLKHRELGAEHVLLGILREGSGLGVRLLVDLGVDLGELRAALLHRMRHAA